MRSAFMSSWLQRTNQRWKLAVFGTTVITLGVVLAAGVGSHSALWIPLSSLALIAVTCLWFFSSIHCAHCGARVGWWAVRTHAINAWLPILITLDRCPRCKR